MKPDQTIRAILKIRTRGGFVARRLAPGDGEALQCFNKNLSEASRQTFLPHSYDTETVSKYIARSEANMDRIYLLLTGDEVVGYFFLWEFRKRIPLLGIGLADAYQGQGLGKQIMSVLIEDARTAGCAGIELTTMQHNERAFQLYQKVGFEYMGTVDNVTGSGEVVRERKMFLPLKEGTVPSERRFKPPV